MTSVIAKTRAEAKALGLGVYHSGKSCPHGHKDGRYASGGQCVTCTYLRRSEAAKDREAENARLREYRSKNKDAYSSRRRAYYQENLDKERARRRADNKKHYEKRSETAKRYKEANKDRVRDAMKAWREKNVDNIRAYRRRNRDYVTARAAVRRARLAVPSWVTGEEKKQMRQIYRKARQLSDATGIPHEVDHIIPLQGDLVCGLHVPSNLRITTQFENRSKRNRFFPEILEAA